ncbi:MAG: hypothetical protein GKR88_01960 [Flavobacteriaceae bacterium]|nr:MAG: hypothetical protein GKR88_01960 [Flavobacteriaceae bacterium]
MKYSMYLLFLLLTNCSSQKEIQENAFLYYGKTACLGTCPVYDLYIYDSGKIIYEGIKNVKRKGKYVLKISKYKIKNDLKPVRDLPSTVISYRGKRIRSSYLVSLSFLVDFKSSYIFCLSFYFYIMRPLQH